MLLQPGDQRIPSVMDSLSVDSLRNHVMNLHFDRNPIDRYEALKEAGAYIESEFLKMGLAVRRDTFFYEQREYYNIIAEKSGRVAPERIFILGAHYDTVPGTPGADDNASAIAVLISVARLLNNVPLRSTLKFIAFSLEEYGYLGSTHYAQRARDQGERVEGMISLEMVGFTSPQQDYPAYIHRKYYPNVGDFIAVVGNQKSEGLLLSVRNALKTYVPSLPAEFLLAPENGKNMAEVRLSDHSPFWDCGFPALLITDTAFLRNPNYHKSSDTIETLDFEFMRKVATGIYYALLELTK